jgi:hypothetical protein
MELIKFLVSSFFFFFVCTVAIHSCLFKHQKDHNQATHKEWREIYEDI